MGDRVCMCGIQEIVRTVVNSGQQFTEQQYVTVVSLSHRSEYGSTDSELQSRLSKLNAILTASAALDTAGPPASAAVDTAARANGLPRSHDAN